MKKGERNHLTDAGREEIMSKRFRLWLGLTERWMQS